MDLAINPKFPYHYGKCLGNLLLKTRRSGLTRPVQASWISVIFAIVAVTAALIGNIYKNPEYLTIFMQYFIPFAVLISIILNRLQLYYIGLFCVKAISNKLISTAESILGSMQKQIDKINSQEVIFFTRGEDISNLNKAMLYVRDNEHTNKLKVITVIKAGTEVPTNLKEDLMALDRVYKSIDVEFLVIEGTFNPDLILGLSEKWKIPTNFMFIACPKGKLFTYTLAELHGVRLII